MELFNLPKQKGKKRRGKRLGMGLGSGKGKTSARGHKGQKARGKVNLGFEGGQLKLIKRLPFLRGVGFKSRAKRPLLVHLSDLEKKMPAGLITLESLKKANLVPDSAIQVKLVGNNRVSKKFIIKDLSVTKGAISQIEKMGGTLEVSLGKGQKLNE